VQIRGKHIVIATGSRPRQLPLYPVNGTSLITTDYVNQLDDLPRSMAVIGAGVVGVEYATIFAGFGQTEVHLLNPGHARLLPNEDPELGELIQHNLANSGVHVYNACTVLDVEVGTRAVTLTLSTKESGGGSERGRGSGRGSECGGTRRIEVEKALLSVGRVANVDQLNLDAANVQVDERGGVRVMDDHCRSSTSHIFVAGDASIDVGLVNVAEMEGRHVVEVMAGDTPSNPVQYDHISSIMFLSPEVAATGLSERECRARRIAYKVREEWRCYAQYAPHGCCRVAVMFEERGCV
jgi:dihydrolipoyl dehydrogenase